MAEKDEIDALTGVLADEIRMYGHAHGSWLPIHLARHLVRQMEAAGWRVIPPGSPAQPSPASPDTEGGAEGMSLPEYADDIHAALTPSAPTEEER